MATTDLVLAMTGASGSPYGIRLLEVLAELPEVETTRRGLASHITGKTVAQVVVRNRNLRCGTGQRRLRLRTTTCTTVLPVMCGALPRRVVSTSGSSGMDHVAAGKPVSCGRVRRAHHECRGHGNWCARRTLRGF